MGMRPMEYARKYGVTAHVIRGLGAARLDAMSEDARELLVGLAKKKLPDNAAVRANAHRMRQERFAANKRLRAEKHACALARKMAGLPKLQRIAGETVRMAPMAVMGAEMLHASPDLPQCVAEARKVMRMMELARRSA